MKQWRNVVTIPIRCRTGKMDPTGVEDYWSFGAMIHHLVIVTIVKKNYEFNKHVF